MSHYFSVARGSLRPRGSDQTWKNKALKDGGYIESQTTSQESTREWKESGPTSSFGEVQGEEECQ